MAFVEQPGQNGRTQENSKYFTAHPPGATIYTLPYENEPIIMRRIKATEQLQAAEAKKQEELRQTAIQVTHQLQDWVAAQVAPSIPEGDIRQPVELLYYVPYQDTSAVSTVSLVTSDIPYPSSNLSPQAKQHNSRLTHIISVMGYPERLVISPSHDLPQIETPHTDCYGETVYKPHDASLSDLKAFAGMITTLERPGVKVEGNVTALIPGIHA